MYQNGSETATGSTGVDPGTSLSIGDGSFIGTIDEVRISTSDLSSDWITTEYNNDTSPGPGSGDFISTLGSEETKIYAPTMSEVLGHGEWFTTEGVKQPFVF
jgi:hypothetical protein